MSRKIMIIWALTITALLATLLLIGNAQKDKVYEDLKDGLKIVVKDYLKKKDLLPSFNEKERVSIEALDEEGYIKNMNKINEYCIVSIDIEKNIILYKYTFNKECKNPDNEEKKIDLDN